MKTSFTKVLTPLFSLRCGHTPDTGLAATSDSHLVHVKVPIAPRPKATIVRRCLADAASLGDSQLQLDAAEVLPPVMAGWEVEPLSSN